MSLTDLTAGHPLLNFVVENDIYSGALSHALGLAQALGPCQLICDLSHLHLETGSYDRTLSAFSEVAANCYAVHIPIGTDKRDALPDDISPGFLSQVGRIMSVHRILPVIECQWGGPASLRCRPHTQSQKVGHFRRWLNLLSHAGIINL